MLPWGFVQPLPSSGGAIIMLYTGGVHGVRAVWPCVSFSFSNLLKRNRSWSGKVYHCMSVLSTCGHKSTETLCFGEFRRAKFCVDSVISVSVGMCSVKAEILLGETGSDWSQLFILCGFLPMWLPQTYCAFGRCGFNHSEYTVGQFVSAPNRKETHNATN